MATNYAEVFEPNVPSPAHKNKVGFMYLHHWRDCWTPALEIFDIVFHCSRPVSGGAAYVRRMRSRAAQQNGVREILRTRLRAKQNALARRMTDDRSRIVRCARAILPREIL